MCVYIIRKASVAFNPNGLLKMNDFSGLQAVTYTVKVLVSQKWCEIDMSLTVRVIIMAYQFVPFPMTLKVISPVARLFKHNPANICATFHMVSTDTVCHTDPWQQLRFFCNVSYLHFVLSLAVIPFQFPPPSSLTSVSTLVWHCSYDSTFS